MDDDADTRKALGELLREEGYAAVGAEHGRAALEQLQAGARPCLILLDLMMPVMDGPTFRTAQLADAELRKIPVVLLTAFATSAPKPLSPTDIVTLRKPIVLPDLLTVVRAFCPHRRL